MKTIKNRLKIALAILSSAVFLSVQPIAYADSCNTNTTPDIKTGATNAQIQQCIKDNPITARINTIVNFLSAAVGMVIAAMIIIGGIQYTMAGDNSSAVTAAKQRITNALIALLAFLFLYAFVQWLVPGGVFG